MKMPKIDTRTLRASFIIAGMLSFAITILVITNHTSDIFSSYKLDLIYYLSMFSICLIGVIPLGTIVYILFLFFDNPSYQTAIHIFARKKCEQRANKNAPYIASYLSCFV